VFKTSEDLQRKSVESKPEKDRFRESWMSESTQNVRQVSSLMYDLPPMSVVKVKKIPLYLKAERDFEIR
jgi:hypothetical protein